MRVHYCDHHVVPLPSRHRFPMHKYGLLRERLLAQGVLAESELIPAELVERELLERVHTADYVRAVFEGTLASDAVRRMGFPWSNGLVRRSLASVGGTVAAAYAALDEDIAGNLAGGTHHAFADHGSGFCVFNDIAVAAVDLLAARRVRRVLVFDVDVHQGDGTAALFEADDRVFTCSLHGARNFPLRKQRSDLDVALEDGTDDEAYLEALRRAWRDALDRAQPDIVFYQAGVDTLASDRLGRLGLSHAGLIERDRFVLAAARAHGLPVAVTLGGGYSEPIEATLVAHVNTYRVAKEVERGATSAGS